MGNEKRQYKHPMTKEYLEKEYIENKKSTRQIAKENDCSPPNVSYYLKKYGIPIRADRHTKDEPGRRFGKLVTIEPVFKYQNNNDVFKWKCQCDCGNIVYRATGQLKSRPNPSCGCDYEQKSGNQHPTWKGAKWIPGSFISKYKRHSKARGIEYNLEIEYLDELFEKQQQKCALSGVDLHFEHYGYKWWDSNASLDRIDSNKGYVEGNVQWVHKDVNFMKQAFGQEYFIKMCGIIYNYNKELHNASDQSAEA